MALSFITHFLMPFDMKWFSIFSLPNDGGLGFTSGMANQRSIFVLIDSNVWACLFQLDIRRYLRIQWHINLLATTQVLQYLTKNASRVLGFSQQLLCLQVCDKINVSTQCLKITENVSFYIASEASSFKFMFRCWFSPLNFSFLAFSTIFWPI